MIGRQAALEVAGGGNVHNDVNVTLTACNGSTKVKKDQTFPNKHKVMFPIYAKRLQFIWHVGKQHIWHKNQQPESLQH